MIDEGSGAFGIVICDINDLKLVNDTEGHNAGDRCIKAACRLICRIFAHSPVFRVGGDEFVVVLKEQDYRNRLSLQAALKEKVQENNRIGARPVVASGLAEYEPDTDRRVADVFNRADARMYEDKTELKEQKLLQDRSGPDENHHRRAPDDAGLALPVFRYRLGGDLCLSLRHAV